MKFIAHRFPPGDSNQKGHTNRVFSIRFLPDNPNIFLSGGWDQTVHIWDIREQKHVGSFFGPSVSGDSIDYSNGLVLVGSYRSTDSIQLWDFGTRKLLQQIPWDSKYTKDNVFVYGAQFRYTRLG